MNIERLKELREETEQYRAVADDRCMGTNYEDDLLALIDEAIARQSVKSEEVQEAIEQMEDALSPRYLESDGEWTGYNEFSTSAIRTAITALQAYHPWISVDDRLPEKPQYDWVLVHITLSPDGFVGLPHVAELRRGKWFSTEYDLPIEQILQGTVTHWKPLPEPPKGE